MSFDLRKADMDTATRSPTRTVAAGPAPAGRAFGVHHGIAITIEGLWGAGKSTAAHELGQRLSGHGFRTQLLHYGPRHGVIAHLSELLDGAPLRHRHGAGGYSAPHHAVVDVLLRWCRQAYHHQHDYRPALTGHDVVIIDHGLYTALAYALTVLGEHPPQACGLGADAAPEAMMERLLACVRPWFLHPHRAFFLDVPWPLARERAIERGYGGGDAASIERLQFLPRFDAAYRQVCASLPERITRVPVGLRSVEEVVADIEHEVLTLLQVPEGADRV
ncbi:dTMP kinase [Streptosporangium sp. G11]|uniref:dTMP kinase n=1 Tax=Streptosporangium sp. G11 TaxID=3436926 RepID=UPI003EB72F7F